MHESLYLPRSHIVRPLLTLLVTALWLTSGALLHAEEATGMQDTTILRASASEFEIVFDQPMLWQVVPFGGKEATGVQYVGFIPGEEPGNSEGNTPNLYFLVIADRPDLNSETRESMDQSLSQILARLLSSEEQGALEDVARDDFPSTPFEQKFLKTKVQASKETLITLIRAVRGEQELMIAVRMYDETSGESPDETNAWSLLDDIQISSKQAGLEASSGNY